MGQTQFVARTGLISLGDATVSGSLAVTGNISGSIQSASFATSASQAQNAVSASYAISASQAENAVSASFAPSTPAFPFTGSAGISGSLVLNGDAYLTGSLLIKPTTVSSGQVFPIIEVFDGGGFEGNIIISRNTNANATGSVVISGSNSIVSLSSAGSNAHVNGGGGVGFRGLNAYVTVIPTITGSLGSGYDRLYPLFSNSTVNASTTITDNRPVGTTQQGFSLSAASLNGPYTSTLTTGSIAISNSNVIGTLTVNSTGSTGATRTLNNSLIGTATITADSNSGTILQNSVVLGNGLVLLLSGSSNGVLQNSLVVGQTLTVTGSATTAAVLGSAFVGRYNDLGPTALAANTAFAVGTGTAAGSRRTSLHVSSSGLTTISNGLITGSLIGTASFADTATSASFASTASFYGGSVVSASFATTASYWSGSIDNALSASYAANAQQATSASFATTASYWSGSITNALSASFATTASFALNAGSGGVQGSEIYSYTFLLMGA